MRLLAILSTRLSALFLACVMVAAFALPAAAQNQVPDMTQFGFPQVADTVTFTPGQATALTAGSLRVAIPADLLTKSVKFELLMGDTAFFAPNPGASQGKQLLAAFAFRVTDTSTGQLVGKFDKPVVFSITDPRITSDSEIYNTSPANPPNVTDNPSPSTIQGTTLSHPFGGAGVGWLVASPAPVAGMPSTGSGILNDVEGILPLALLAGIAVVSSGLTIRRKAKRTA